MSPVTGLALQMTPLKNSDDLSRDQSASLFPSTLIPIRSYYGFSPKWGPSHLLLPSRRLPLPWKALEVTPRAFELSDRKSPLRQMKLARRRNK